MIMHSCGHDDCFTCPFKDCTVDGCEPDEVTATRGGRNPRLTNEERLAKKREQARKYYHRHKEKILAKKNKEYREKTAV